MIGQNPQCYIPSHKVIGPLVLEMIFEGFLPCMGMAAVLVIWPRPHEQTFIPPSHWGSIWNLALIGQAVLEKILKMVDDGSWLHYKLTNEPKGSGELTSKNSSQIFYLEIWSRKLKENTIQLQKFYYKVSNILQKFCSKFIWRNKSSYSVLLWASQRMWKRCLSQRWPHKSFG